MMKSPLAVLVCYHRAFTTFLALVVLMSGSGIAIAQIQPPAQKDTVSETGVSYLGGSFSTSALDLQIGGEDFPRGLALRREYNSSLNAVFGPGLSQGWTTNLSVMVSNSTVPPISNFNPPPPQNQKFLYSVVIGSRRVGFYGGSTNPTGGPIGTYTPVEPGGQTLVYTGDAQTGHYTFTDGDGTVIVFLPGTWKADTIKAPDGAVLKFYYSTILTAVFSSRGYAILFQPGTAGWSKACVVNLAQHYVTSTSACPSDAPSVSYAFTNSPNGLGPLLTQVTDATGGVTTYGYVGMDHLGCITPPGASGCQISNVYNVCQRTPPATQDPPYMRLSDQVVSQSLADGRSYTYSFAANPLCPLPPYQGNDITRSASDGTTRRVQTGESGLPTSVTDEIGRVTGYTIMTYNLLYGKLIGVTNPEGDSSQFSLPDSRGNFPQETLVPKANSGLANRTRNAVYTSACTYPTSCNKPTSATDWAGNAKTFTYDPVHGGVLTETDPAVNGITPQKRYTYAQRTAWISNGAGGWVAAGAPIWVLTQASFCKVGNPNSTNTGCANGSSDEVITTYDYGPDAGPNTLLLRGTVVDTGGLALRTCYSYDAVSNKISETKPRAGLASCP